jgi:DNA modification methylase
MAIPNNATDNSAPIPALPIEQIPIGLLRPNPRNPRTHSKKQIGKIAASMGAFGFVGAIVVDNDNTILAGHGRFEAAKLAGYKKVPVVRIGHLSPAQMRAYMIADNKIAEDAGWDLKILAVELDELNDLLPPEGLDVSSTGFDTPEIDLVLNDMGPPPKQEPEDVSPAPPKNPVSRFGDMWLLREPPREHRLLCGDAQEPADFARLMDGAIASAVFCDPPYNLRAGAIGGRGRVRHQDFAFGAGEMSRRQYRRFLRRTLLHAVEVSKPGAIHFVCMDWRHVDLLMEVGREIFGAMLNLVVWNKTNAGQGSFYRSQHELIVVFRVGELQHRNNIELGRYGRNRSNVWLYPGVNSFGRGRMDALAAHPTVKPVALVADALLDCTARGEIVLDQFAGSGTTILAAEKVGRIAFGIEFEPRYVDVAIKRWQKMTKLEATLDGDGRTFEEIGKARLNAADEPQRRSGGANA